MKLIFLLNGLRQYTKCLILNCTVCYLVYLNFIPICFSSFKTCTNLACCVVVQVIKRGSDLTIASSHWYNESDWLLHLCRKYCLVNVIIMIIEHVLAFCTYTVPFSAKNSFLIASFVKNSMYLNLRLLLQFIYLISECYHVCHKEKLKFL